MNCSFVVLLILVIVHFSSEVFENPSSECSIEFDTDEGIRECSSEKCSNIKDPIRIRKIFNNNGRCSLDHLKLGFTNYDLLLLFVEYQTKNDHYLDEFFSDDHRQSSILEVRNTSI